MIAGLAQFHSLAIVVLGLIVLLATPVMQLAVSTIAFAVEEDRTYVIVTSLVLAILLFSIFGMGHWFGKPGPAPVQDDTLPFFFMMLGSSVFAGFIGALVGLGGGVLLVPLAATAIPIAAVMSRLTRLISLRGLAVGCFLIYGGAYGLAFFNP
ncbi:MAG: DUF1634 domain-containing protein, partial [Acetobacteraceae bacterium]